MRHAYALKYAIYPSYRRSSPKKNHLRASAKAPTVRSIWRRSVGHLRRDSDHFSRVTSPAMESVSDILESDGGSCSCCEAHVPVDCSRLPFVLATITVKPCWRCQAVQARGEPTETKQVHGRRTNLGQETNGLRQHWSCGNAEGD